MKYTLPHVFKTPVNIAPSDRGVLIISQITQIITDYGSGVVKKINFIVHENLIYDKGSEEYVDSPACIAIAMEHLRRELDEVKYALLRELKATTMQRYKLQALF